MGYTHLRLSDIDAGLLAKILNKSSTILECLEPDSVWLSECEKECNKLSITEKNVLKFWVVSSFPFRKSNHVIDPSYEKDHIYNHGLELWPDIMNEEFKSQKCDRDKVQYFYGELFRIFNDIFQRMPVTTRDMLLYRRQKEMVNFRDGFLSTFASFCCCKDRIEYGPYIYFIKVNAGQKCLPLFLLNRDVIHNRLSDLEIVIDTVAKYEILLEIPECDLKLD